MHKEEWHQITLLHGKHGVPMQLHNIVSYAITSLVFPAVVLFVRKDPDFTQLFERPLLALATLLWVLHFLRRTAESAWVHRYSKPPAPYVGVLLEYIYYWGQGGFIAYTLAAPDYRFPGPLQLILGVALFAAAETGNAWSHFHLHKLRAPGETAHRIPRGGMFERVSSPHYFFEITAWWGFALAFPCWGTFLFASLTTAILLTWGLTRHRSYLRHFDGQEGREMYPKQRRAVLPFLF
ncbi:MAG: DUF1295 domain-containing protein [Polyangiaceae bacterium]|nr:DUF1295 domain-containing protein [Polyangiaceae bacterium]